MLLQSAPTHMIQISPKNTLLYVEVYTPMNLGIFVSLKQLTYPSPKNWHAPKKGTSPIIDFFQVDCC